MSRLLSPTPLTTLPTSTSSHPGLLTTVKHQQVGAGLGDDDDEDPFFGTKAVEVPSDDEHDDKKAHLQVR